MPNRTPHSRKVFSRLANRIRISGVIQSQHNKSKQIRHPLRNERTAEILALAELNPHDSLKHREKDSDISHNVIWLILKENKLKLYKMSVHQSLTHDDFEQRNLHFATG